MGGGYRLICANIVAKIIQDMAPILYRALAADGILLTSGILKSREEEVRAVLEENGFHYIATHESEEWVCMEWSK
jgi:ribosomal protein L11 methyltransferase